MESSESEIKLHFEGVLEKAGKRFFEGFRKRWFILDGKDLTYYKAPEYTDENYLGTIDLSQVKSVTQTKMASNGFQIITRARTYTFSAPTPELLADWLSVLRQSMQLKSFQSRKNSRAESIESQYEEVETRSQRSASAVSVQSDINVEDTDINLYEIIGPTEKTPPNSSAGDYELIPQAGSSKNKSYPSDVNDGSYDIIGGPSSNKNKAASSVGAPPGVASSSDSVGAPSDSEYGLVGPPSSPINAGPSGPLSEPAYGLVGLPSSPVNAGPNSEPAYGLVGTPSSPGVAASDIPREVSGLQSDTAPPAYATVQRRSMSANSEVRGSASSDNLMAEMPDGSPPTKGKAENGFDSSLTQYAEVRRPKDKFAEGKEDSEGDRTKSDAKEASLSRYDSLKQQRMLSMISEDDGDKVEEEDLEARPLPSPTSTDAITEMKKFLEQAEQDESVERPDENESPVIGSGQSAFELLKQLLQRLDAQEPN